MNDENGSNSGSNGQATVRAPEVQRRKVDYDAYAKERGEEAAETARAMGLSEAEIARFKEVFGAPVPQEFRST